MPDLLYIIFACNNFNCFALNQKVEMARNITNKKNPQNKQFLFKTNLKWKHLPEGWSFTEGVALVKNSSRGGTIWLFDRKMITIYHSFEPRILRIQRFMYLFSLLLQIPTCWNLTGKTTLFLISWKKIQDRSIQFFTGSSRSKAAMDSYYNYLYTLRAHVRKKGHNLS